MDTSNLQVGFGIENTFSMDNENIELKKATADIESKSKLNGQELKQFYEIAYSNFKKPT